MIDRYGVYMNHLVSLTEDHTVKATDKQKLKGYIKQWKNAKTLLGCGVFAEILKPVGILSKLLQNVTGSAKTEHNSAIQIFSV